MASPAAIGAMGAAGGAGGMGGATGAMGDTGLLTGIGLILFWSAAIGWGAIPPAMGLISIASY